MGLTETQLEDAALAPQRTTTEEGTVEEHDLDDLVKADQYLSGKQACSSPPWGMKIAKARPGNALGDSRLNTQRGFGTV